MGGAAPQEQADLTREFQHHAPDVWDDHTGVTARMLVGSLGTASSPIHTETPLMGAEVTIAPGTTWEAPVDAAMEHGVLVDTGVVDFDGVRLDNSALGVRDAGLDHLRLHNPTDKPARLMLLGGEPFDEGIVMWWNFIGRTHDDIVGFRQEWNEAPDDRFGRVKGYQGSTKWLAAPPIPDVTLKQRFRRGRAT
ncbi:pirin-like C-terminal cupin domain-containing protein [Propionibacteriaceae bacterium Y1923]